MKRSKAFYFIRNHQRRLTLMINQINEAHRQDIKDASRKMEIKQQL
ncbi:MAG: hypothetical protein U5K79_14935 [Cyclobacteriaceae bacterium]|nr:hypothetical protein [Cyclobacteriaceae bacterium]